MKIVPAEASPTSSASKGQPRAALDNLDCIALGDPVAAGVLYTLYADQIRSYLQRHTGLSDVEDAVFNVLLETVRSVRALGSTTSDQLARTVQELSQQGVFALRRSLNAGSLALGGSPERDVEVVSAVLTALDCEEREVLLRSILLCEPDEEISNNLALPELEIRKTRAKARVLFRVSTQFGQTYAAATPA